MAVKSNEIATDTNPPGPFQAQVVALSRAELADLAKEFLLEPNFPDSSISDLEVFDGEAYVNERGEDGRVWYSTHIHEPYQALRAGKHLIFLRLNSYIAIYTLREKEKTADERQLPEL